MSARAAAGVRFGFRADVVFVFVFVAMSQGSRVSR